jgi:uncharacterized membrane protein YqaE (UPF0057 family)
MMIRSRGLLIGLSFLVLVGVSIFAFMQASANSRLAAPPLSEAAQRAFAQADVQRGVTPTTLAPAAPTPTPALPAPWDTVAGLAGFLIGGTLAIAIYFLPTIAARKRRSGTAIFLLNLLLGWTLLGWVVALVWAAIPDQPSSSSTNTTSSPVAMP